MGQGMSSGGSMPVPSGQNSFVGNPNLSNQGAFGSSTGTYGAPGSGAGAAGKGGSQQMAAPNAWQNPGDAQNSLAGKAASYGPGMWGQNANQGLMFGLGGQPPPGWGAPNLQGGPLPGAQSPVGAPPLGVLPGVNGGGVAPPPFGGTAPPPDIPTKQPVGGPVPGVTAPLTGITSVPGANGPPLGTITQPPTSTAPPPGTTTRPTLDSQQKAAVGSAGPLSFGGTGTTPYATSFSKSTFDPSRYGAAGAAQYNALPQSFSVSDFNKISGANPALATQMLAAGGQSYKDAVAKANGWSTDQMNQFINTNGSGALSGFTPQALAQMKALGVG